MFFEFKGQIIYYNYKDDQWDHRAVFWYQIKNTGYRSEFIGFDVRDMPNSFEPDHRKRIIEAIETAHKMQLTFEMLLVRYELAYYKSPKGEDDELL